MDKQCTGGEIASNCIGKLLSVIDRFKKERVAVFVLQVSVECYNRMVCRIAELTDMPTLDPANQKLENRVSKNYKYNNRLSTFPSWEVVHVSASLVICWCDLGATHRE